MLGNSPKIQTAQEPGWQVMAEDTHVGTLCGGFVLMATVAAAGLLWHLRRLADVDTSDAKESVPLVSNENGQGQSASASRTRAIVVLSIGLSPLGSCLLVGGSLHNVIAAMFAMHWLCMVLLPLIYYELVAGFGDHKELVLVASFYRKLMSEESRDIPLRLARGSLIGLPVCCCILVAYSLGRCRTLRWPLCVQDLREPMEDNGFQEHSMIFRLMAALYFTFWNPVVEEFFWRVFLHRELTTAIVPLVASEQAATRQHPHDADVVGAEQAPWSQLWQDIKLMLLSFPAMLFELPKQLPGFLPRAVACAMYASYHMWPISVLFGNLWWIYALGGFAFLYCLGRFLLLMRENSAFGLAAAYALHMWVDAAFAAMCLLDPAALASF